MSTLERLRLEMDRTLRPQGERPSYSTRMTRRIFLHRSLALGAASAATYGFFPLLNVLDVAFAADGQAFKFAWLSDTHLYPKDVNTRFVDKTVRAVQEVQAMNPPADFLIFGRDLAQLGDPVELRLGAELLKELKIKKVFIPGEHDWYLDMGKTWNEMFGQSPWKLDHKGVRFLGLDTVSHAEDFWTGRKMSPKERMGHMATLDGTLGGAWAAVGPEQIKWLNDALADWPKDKPVVVFSHNPLYEYYPPWNFWVRDWQAVHEVLKPFSNVTNIHGHTHQVLYNEIGKVRSIGMLATSWPWPYAPEGVPILTRPMVRADPGDHFDGVGWSALALTAGACVLLAGAVATNQGQAHKAEHAPEQLQAFHGVFMDQVKTGDLLFHGDAATEKRLGVKLSATGMACAMCHPYASDTHPYEFPKFQEQMNEFATLRDMINWCIEKPNEGEKIDPNGEAMKALEAYIYWSNRNARLDPGRH